MRRSTLLTMTAATALALAGCASGGESGDSTDSDTGRLSIVASTDVYGDIASQIVGDDADVMSIITGAAQDPHSYEASARDQLALSRADLVIENGGGYDPFVDTLLGDDPSAAVIDASEASGLLEGDGHDDDAQRDAAASASPSEDENDATDDHEHSEGFNEHVWYSFHGVEHTAEAILDEVQSLDSANADAYQANYDGFAAELRSLHDRVRALESQTAGRSAAITEPVPLYLLEDAGLTNATPPEFSEAIEEGTDVAPSVLRQTLAIFDSGSVALLAYNSQTAGPETEEVRAAAESAGVPVVEFTETLPDGEDYLGWMSANVDAIEKALAG